MARVFFLGKRPLKLNDLFISCGMMEEVASQQEFGVHAHTASNQSYKPHNNDMFSVYWSKSGMLSSRPPITEAPCNPFPQAHLTSPQKHVTTATLKVLANKHVRWCAAGHRPMSTHVHCEYKQLLVLPQLRS